MAEISKGFYETAHSSIFITKDQYMWKYSWFYHGDTKENVYLLAQEFKTNKTIAESIDSRPGDNLTPKIEEILLRKTDAIKQGVL